MLCVVNSFRNLFAYDWIAVLPNYFIKPHFRTKDHNIWIQGFVPGGGEEEIVDACTAAYDAGARTLLSWSFHGGESNTYRCENPSRAWSYTVEAFKGVKSMERNRILEENRKKYRK